MTDRAIEATTDGTRVHVRIYPPFPGEAPLSRDEAAELARQLLTALPPDLAASVAREALALDAVRAAEAQQVGRQLEAYHDEEDWPASDDLPAPAPGSIEDMEGQAIAERQADERARATLAALAALSLDREQRLRVRVTTEPHDQLLVEERDGDQVVRCWYGPAEAWNRARESR